MTDRIKGFTVVLSKDIRDDDFEAISSAVGMIKGVIKVEPSISNGQDWMNRERVKMELTDKLWDVLR